MENNNENDLDFLKNKKFIFESPDNEFAKLYIRLIHLEASFQALRKYTVENISDSTGRSQRAILYDIDYLAREFRDELLKEFSNDFQTS